MKLWKWLLAVTAVCSLVACGGSVDSSSTDGTDGSTDTPVAADLSLELSATSVSNTGSESVTVTATAVDSSRNALSGIPIAISVDNNALVVVDSSATADEGTVTGTASIGSDRTNRIVTVTATSGSLTRTAAFQVVGAALQSTALPAVLAPGDTGVVTFRLVDANGSAMTNQAISVSGNGLTAASGTTSINGDYDFTYVAPATAGSLDIQATAGGTSTTATVLVQANGTIPAVNPATSPVRSASVSANPSVVSVNTDSTSNRTELRALFVSDANAPVQNIRVRFDLNGDANSIGGTISSGTNVLYSNSNGIATSAYIPGSRSSPTDGVTIRACWDYGDFAASACPHETLTTLTVNAEALSVTIGTNNLIESGSSDLTYIKKYVVLVVDSAGQAKPDVQISPSIDLTHYSKGFYRKGTSEWSLASPGYAGVTCSNEDINRNAVLEGTEDINLNGQLDPRKSDVAITVVGSDKTNESGIVILQIEYPKSVATWVDFRILVAASGIAGSEGRATFVDRLPAARSEFTGDATPSFAVSPYGRGNIDSNSDGALDCRDKD